MTLLAEVPLEGGAGRARLTAVGGTSRRLEIELSGRTFVDDYDPRDTGALAFVGFHAWHSHPDELVSTEDRARITSAIFELLAGACGVTAVLEHVARGDERFYVLRRPIDRARPLARVYGSGAEILLPGRTLHVEGRRETAAGDNRLVVRPATARWVYPSASPPTADAWAEVRGAVKDLGRDDFFLTDFPWRFVEDGGP